MFKKFMNLIFLKGPTKGKKYYFKIKSKFPPYKNIKNFIIDSKTVEFLFYQLIIKIQLLSHILF